MTQSEIDKLDNATSEKIITAVPQNNESFPMLCGPGCACGNTENKTGKLRIVRMAIMLIIIVAVVIGLIYQKININ
ncbi:MAG: hypothetical protein ABR534_08515 [Desulfotignum sp.]|nr:hypothetical protein [Desulfobacteraceae bacterium]